MKSHAATAELRLLRFPTTTDFLWMKSHAATAEFIYLGEGM